MAFEFGADELLCAEDDATPGNTSPTTSDNGASVASGGFLEQKIVEEEEVGADAEGKGDDAARITASGLPHFSDLGVNDPELLKLFEDFRTGSTERCGNSEPGMAARASSSSSRIAVRMLVSWRQPQRTHPSGPRRGPPMVVRSLG